MAGTIIAQLGVVGILLLNGFSIDDLGKGLPSLSLSAGVLAAVIGVSQLLSYLMNASIDLPDWASSIEGDIAGVLDTLITSSSWPTFAIVLLIIGVLPALGEEIIFRGLIQPAVIKSTGSAHFGIWVTALMFGLVHMQFAGVLPRVFLGAVLGFLAYYSQRLWIPIIVHFLFNGLQALAVRLSWMDVEQAAEATEQVGTVQILATMIVAAAGLFFFLPKLAPNSENKTGDDDSELLNHLEA